MTADDIKKLGTILGVWAHPDDESFCAGGLIAQAVKNGQNVICVTATKGEAGVQDPKWADTDLSNVRDKELQNALDILGVNEQKWLGYHDGHCKDCDQREATAKIAKYIEKYQPDTIITFGEDGMTGHDDHACVSKWASAAAENARKKPIVYQVANTKDHYEKFLKQLDETLNIFFNIDEPRLVDAKDCALVFELSPELQEVKIDALAAQVSQTEKMMQSFDRDFLEKAFGLEAFIRAA